MSPEAAKAAAEAVKAGQSKVSPPGSGKATGEKEKCPACNEMIPRVLDTCPFCTAATGFRQRDEAKLESQRQYAEALKRKHKQTGGSWGVSIVVGVFSLLILAVSLIGLFNIGSRDISLGMVLLGFAVGLTALGMSVHGIFGLLKN
jgi:hypothetical protein